MTNETNDGKRMDRGRFLGFIGKVGVLTLLTSIPVLGAEIKLKRPTSDEHKIAKLTPGKLRYSDILRSPLIKGKKLSKVVLEGKLATKNLENLRDLLTGRFFGRAAEDALKDGYAPLIYWSLNSKGTDSGCFLHACTGHTVQYLDCPPVIMSSKCTLQMISREENEKLMIDIVNSIGISDFVSQVGCGDYCSGQCTNEGGCGHKCGEQCSPQASIDIAEVVSYPGDMFASELLKILGSTDVGVIQRELKNVIFSDQVLNMGLQHVILAAHDGIAEGLESGRLAL